MIMLFNFMPSIEKGKCLELVFLSKHRPSLTQRGGLQRRRRGVSWSLQASVDKGFFNLAKTHRRGRNVIGNGVR